MDSCGTGNNVVKINFTDLISICHSLEDYIVIFGMAS